VYFINLNWLARLSAGVLTAALPYRGRWVVDQLGYANALAFDEWTQRQLPPCVMVLPSIEEGLALVQGQAMACGCPVIASTNTGSQDLYTNEIEGFIVPIRDPGALTQRMQQLAEDPDLRQRMSEAALVRVKSLGGWKDYGDQWEKLLQEAIKRSA
jgi:glycosyltransferase involved in cell wall biosynthesis